MAVHVASEDRNDRGDLFNERMKDVAQALGYEVIRTNIHKPGREIDIIAKHSIEDRRAVIECKAKKEKIGGGDVNKFVGAVDAERIDGETLSTFFISISGFTDSAIEQEAAIGRRRVSLMGPTEIEDQLIRGRIVVPRETAFFKAGAASASPPESTIDAEADLVADESGWIWLIYFLESGERTAFTLVHADGDFPSPRVGQRVAQYIKRAISENLAYVEGVSDNTDDDFTRERNEYLQYILSEYGEFTLEGFPVDQHLGSKSIELEELYVPQFLEPISESDDPEQSTSVNSRRERQPLSQILTENSAITILGPPGAGKSTLIKRLATGYAAPDRLARIADDLPELDRLPLVLKCREIQGANAPLLEILRSIPERAEIPSIRTNFSALVDRSVRDGGALILIDGLDEFPTTADRAKFLRQLRTFIMRYPLCTVIITSREAGFREVAGFVSDRFAKYRIAELRNEDILSLTTAWHKQVYGDTHAATVRARELVVKIIETDRVRRLAVNPLLLTTLLLVQRWVGDLPRKRSVLYEKAIELLLMTWNVEGHEPLDLDEVKPHLAYLAHSMTTSGKQQISHDEMLSLFRKARGELEEVLGYCTTSPQELLRRIEFRSSLLNLIGYAVHEGTLQPMYEFKHLTFQEYLAAVAISQAWHEGASLDGDSVQEIKDHVLDPRWREVIALYGVLAGRRGRSVIEFLCELAETYDEEQAETDDSEEGDSLESEHGRNEYLHYLLYQCLVDEVQAPSLVVDRALHLVVPYVDDADFDALLTGRYGKQLTEKAQGEIANPTHGDSPYIGVLGRLFFVQLPRNAEVGQIIESLRARILGNSERDRIGALSALMHLAYWNLHAEEELEQLGLDADDVREICRACFDCAASNVEDHNVVMRFTSLWAVSWVSESFRPSEERLVELLPKFTELYFTDEDKSVRRMAAWALADVTSGCKSGVIQLSPERLEIVNSWLDKPVPSENWIPHEMRAAIWFATRLDDPFISQKASRILESVESESEIARWIDRIMS
ncbi:NACHT domain-containing protein [Streptomyces mirabilis]|uniref:NACHT domain-containing protein n=1 Tax=Streptomyces mirabilis TaxID=68239 RepID=UPI0036518922